MRNFKRYETWQRAHALTLAVYRASERFPQAETFGLKAQIRRAAISVPSNLAEGAGRSSDRDFARFVSVAVGSVNEVDYQLMLARDLGYLDPETYLDLADGASQVRRMLTSLRKRLSN